MGPRIKPRSISLVLFFVLDLVIHLNHRHEQWLENLSGSNISWPCNIRNLLDLEPNTNGAGSNRSVLVHV